MTDRLPIPMPRGVETRPNAADAALASAFDRWWEVYPRKASKGAARRAWPRAVARAGGDVARLVAAAEAYRDDPNREAEFTKHPATWLNGECWDDEPLPARSAGRAQVSGALGALGVLARADRRGLPT